MHEASERPLLTLIEAGGMNDLPVIMPVAVPNVALIEALKTVREAGYRVSKPQTPKKFKRGKDRVGPTFVCKFADGTVTRMSVFTSLEKLDWERGEHLSQAAYQSRWRTRERAQQLKQTGRAYAIDFITPAPPAIISARFEQDGNVLAQRAPFDLDAVDKSDGAKAEAESLNLTTPMSAGAK